MGRWLSRSANSGSRKQPCLLRRTLLKSRHGYYNSNLSSHIENFARKKSNIGKSWLTSRRNSKMRKRLKKRIWRKRS